MIQTNRQLLELNVDAIAKELALQYQFWKPQNIVVIQLLMVLRGRSSSGFQLLGLSVGTVPSRPRDNGWSVLNVVQPSGAQRRGVTVLAEELFI